MAEALPLVERLYLTRIEQDFEGDVLFNSGGGHTDETWDAHGDVNRNHELHCGDLEWSRREVRGQFQPGAGVD